MAAEHVAYLNGSLVPLSQASLSIFDAGVLSGAIVSERLRTFRHEPFLLDEHVARLAASAEAAHVPLSLSAAEIADLIREVVRLNAELVPAEYDLGVSVFSTPGVDLAGTFCVYATPIPAHLYAGAYDAGLSLVTPPTRAIPGESLSPQIKTRSRLHWHIADAQAGRIEPGSKALLVDDKGFVTETATGNLFVVPPGGLRILTPRRTKTLGGSSRAYVLDLLPLDVEEADLRPEDVASAGEAFVTSSVYCLLPVVRLNRAPVGRGAGPIYRKLLADWSDRVGVDIAGQMRQMASAAGHA